MKNLSSITKKISIHTLNDFLVSRNDREKKMFLGLSLALLLFLDYAVWIGPMIGHYGKIAPDLAAAKKELTGLRDDQKNSEVIEKNFGQTKEDLAAAEKRFIAPSEVPALLENLSKSAQESGVKILSVAPEEVRGEKAILPFSRVYIRISALAGTHAMGRFLSKLEGGATFFRILDFRMGTSAGDPARHEVALALEAYRKG